MEDLQQREEHWAIVDLVGKAGHIRTVPMPDWVYLELVTWLSSASIDRGKIFRRISRTGRVLGDGISEKAIWHVVRSAASKVGIPALAPHDLRRTCARPCRSVGVSWIRSSFCSDMSRFRQRSSTLDRGGASCRRSMIGLALSPVLNDSGVSRRKTTSVRSYRGSRAWNTIPTKLTRWFWHCCG